VKNVACMKDCPVDPKIRSALPDFARDAHGNIQEQNRVIGPVRGADTTKPPPAQPLTQRPWPHRWWWPQAGWGGGRQRPAQHQRLHRLPRHQQQDRGPRLQRNCQAKHKGKADAQAYLVGKIKNGGSGVFGAIPMPAQPQLSDADASAIAPGSLRVPSKFPVQFLNICNSFPTLFQQESYAMKTNAKWLSLLATAAAAAGAAHANVDAAAAKALATKSACLACHAVDRKMVGPSYKDMAAKYKGMPTPWPKLAASIKAGGSGKYGPVPMPAQPQLKRRRCQDPGRLDSGRRARQVNPLVRF
jgi:cytochrome c551/c552